MDCVVSSLKACDPSSYVLSCPTQGANKGHQARVADTGPPAAEAAEELSLHTHIQRFSKQWLERGCVLYATASEPRLQASRARKSDLSHWVSISQQRWARLRPPIRATDLSHCWRPSTSPRMLGCSLAPAVVQHAVCVSWSAMNACPRFGNGQVGVHCLLQPFWICACGSHGSHSVSVKAGCTSESAQVSTMEKLETAQRLWRPSPTKLVGLYVDFPVRWMPRKGACWYRPHQSHLEQF